MKIILKKNSLYFLISLAVSLLSISLKGVIHINTQVLTPMMNTYSGGFPVTWFEFYYPRDINLSFRYIYNNFTNHYKIDLLAFFLNVLMIILIILIIEKLVCLLHNKLRLWSHKIK